MCKASIISLMLKEIYSSNAVPGQNLELYNSSSFATRLIAWRGRHCFQVDEVNVGVKVANARANGASSRPNSMFTSTAICFSPLVFLYWKYKYHHIQMSDTSSYKDVGLSGQQHDALQRTDPEDCIPCRVTG
jgi:hypothetical protein